MELYRYIKKKLTGGRFWDLFREIGWVWNYIVRYRSFVAVHLMLGILAIGMTLGSSVASKFLIDAVVHYDSGVIGSAAALMIGTRLAGIALNAVSARIGSNINIRVQNELQGEVYRRILNTDWLSLEGFRSGDLLNRLSSDVSVVSGGVTGFIPQLISGVIQLLGAFCIILYYDPVMAVIALVGVPLTGLCSTFLVHKMRRNNREMKDLYAGVMSFQQDSFQNITTIKAFGVMDWFGGRMETLQNNYRSKYMEYSGFSVWTSSLMSLLSLAAYIGCFGWGVYRMWQGAISYGEMTMFMQLSGILGSAFSGIVGLVPQGISVTTSAGRVMAVTELPEEDRNVQPGFDREESWTLLLENVEFSYKSGAPVLTGAAFEARPGELVCLTGPSGEGKTTLLRIMLGLIRPTSGQAVLVGSSGKRYHLSAATRSCFGYVPQGNRLFAGTVADNLRVSKPDATEEEMIRALKIACAYDFVMALPGGLDHVVGGRDKRLSEGQAQRLGVARALLRRAPILLLDEATSALDMATEAELLKNLMDSGLVRTCILVTHRPAGRDLCSRSYRIRAGRVEEDLR